MTWLHHPRVAILAKAAFWLACAGAVVLALLPMPPHLVIDQFGDKFEHILAFSVLSGLAAFAYPRALRWRVAERLSFLGALIEVAQSIPALHRDCDIRDWIADTLAIVVVTALAQLLMHRTRPVPRDEVAGDSGSQA